MLQDSERYTPKSIRALSSLMTSFGYLRKRGVSVCFDSKENFDTNYQSNWYYYYKVANTILPAEWPNPAK